MYHILHAELDAGREGKLVHTHFNVAFGQLAHLRLAIELRSVAIVGSLSFGTAVFIKTRVNVLCKIVGQCS